VFNIGPLEFLVLAAVALMVFGPDKLPQLTKDAARMLRTLRDMAQGARSQLTDELGPEFANFDLNSLNPRTAIRNALLGDDDLASLNPKDVLARALRGEDEPAQAAADSANGVTQANGVTPVNGVTPLGGVTAAEGGAPAVQPHVALPEQPAPYDPDAT
jgi:sec-independent protein translocase protein TatB